MSAERSEPQQRHKPRRGVSSLSLRFAKAEDSPGFESPRLNQRMPSPRGWADCSPSPSEHRRSGYSWFGEPSPGAEPRTSSQKPSTNAGSEWKELKGLFEMPKTSRSPHPYPVFEDFRASDTPPPVFFPKSTHSPHETKPTQQASPSAALKAQAKRPKSGPRGISFSIGLLGLCDNAMQDEMVDMRIVSDSQSRRSSHTPSVNHTQPDSAVHPTNEGSRRDSMLEKLGSLRRSSTAGSVKEWPGVKGHPSNEKLADQPEQRQMRNRKADLVAGMKLPHIPHISTFRTEHEYRALSNKRSDVDVADHDPSPTTPGGPSASPKKELSSFFKALSKKSVASLKSLPPTPSAESTPRSDPMSHITSPHGRAPPSPSKIPGASLWQPARKSQNESPGDYPILVIGQRTNTFNDAPGSPSAHRDRHGSKTPNFRPQRPALARNESSQISPFNISKDVQSHQKHFPFEQDILESPRVLQGRLEPPKKHPRKKKSSDYLATEAKRVKTPPAIQSGKGNRLMGHIKDHWYPGKDDESAMLIEQAKAQKVYTPFPMPRGNTFIGSDTVRPPALGTLDPDYYRVRLDRIMGNRVEVGMDTDVKASEYDTPDHLPGSPLCPANPKHRSGGTGVCIFHGRGKTKVSE